MFYVHRRLLLNSLAALAIWSLSGCATDISSKSYSDDSVGEVAETRSAVVLRVRTVKVAPDQLDKSHVGIVGGGLGGALIGSQISSGFTGALATVGLAGAGATGGAIAEKALRTQQGMEITVRFANGSLRTLVQGNDVSFKKGEHVLLLIYTRGRSKVIKEDETALVGDLGAKS